MTIGIEESFVIRLKTKYRPLMTKTQFDTLLKDTTANDLMLRDDYKVDQETGLIRGAIYDYGRKLILNNVSWDSSALSSLILAANRYPEGIVKYFKELQTTSFVHKGFNITWNYFTGTVLLSDLSDDDIRKEITKQLSELTEFDFSDIGSILNMHTVEYVYREEFKDKPSFVIPEALVGGIKITGNIVNGVFYLIDSTALLLATENRYGVLSEASIGIIIEQSDPNIIGDQGNRIDDLHPTENPNDLHTEKGEKLHTEGDDQFITED